MQDKCFFLFCIYNNIEGRDCGVGYKILVFSICDNGRINRGKIISSRK